MNSRCMPPRPEPERAIVPILRLLLIALVVLSAVPLAWPGQYAHAADPEDWIESVASRMALSPIPLKLSETRSRPELEQAMRDAYEHQRFDEARQLAEMLALMDDATGYRMLGVLNEQGRCTAPNLDLAELNYRRAADAGDGKSELNLGRLFYEGRGMAPPDYGKARYWFQRAAEHLEPRGMFFLGVFYENGYGVPTDPTMAIQWFRRAAEMGYAPAQEKLTSHQ